MLRFFGVGRRVLVSVPYAHVWTRGAPFDYPAGVSAYQLCASERSELAARAIFLC